MRTEGTTAHEGHAQPPHEDHRVSFSKALIAGGATALLVVIFAPLVTNTLTMVGYDLGLAELLVASALVGGALSILSQLE